MNVGIFMKTKSGFNGRPKQLYTPTFSSVPKLKHYLWGSPQTKDSKWYASLLPCPGRKQQQGSADPYVLIYTCPFPVLRELTRPQDILTPTQVGQRNHDAHSSEPMCRKRARTSQYGPGVTAKNGPSVPLLDTKSWQLDNNVPYYGHTNPSTSGPCFKARRTSTGRMPINIPGASPNIRIYEPAEFLRQSGGFASPNFSASARPQNGFSIPSSSLEVPSPFSASPTTTATSSERYSNTTPSTSIAMSRETSLATSFCDAFGGMVRTNSGFSEIDLGQNVCQQDSCYAPYPNTFSPDRPGVNPPFDPSLYFAHAEGTAINNSSATGFAVEQPQLPTTLELDAEMKRDVSTSSVAIPDQAQSPSPPNIYTKMTRDASSDTNVSSVSRISRRSQEQVAQAARPIAPKDLVESPMSKQQSPALSGGQAMLRQRSAPEPKVLIPKLQYSRHAKEKLKCKRCNKNPDGYRGSHELHRHMALDHNSSRTAWVCVDVSSNGFLSGCAACESKKAYGQDYNAAAHLRRFHFHPKSEVRRTNVDPEHRRGGKGGGKDPPMTECRRWMKKVEVPGKDFTALADSVVDDASEDDEDYDEEKGEQDKFMGNSLPGHEPIDDEMLQNHDTTVEQQILASSVDNSSRLNRAVNSDEEFALEAGDVPFCRSGLQPAFATPYGTFFDKNAGNFNAPSINSAYVYPTLSSPAPAAPFFRDDSSENLDQAHEGLAYSTLDSSQLPAILSAISPAHLLEDFSSFQASYITDNISYGMSSSNNPLGLLDFHPSVPLS